jgi:predicted kinase
MQKINIEKINLISEPLYILIAGSIGAGKSFVVSKYLDNFEVIDPDEITMALGNGKYIPTNVAKAMAMTKKNVSTKLKDGNSFIQQGTAANLQSTINKLLQAKNNGYTTVLLYVDTSINQAIINVSIRTDRSDIPLKKIERTSEGAKHTFEFMSKKHVSDEAKKILKKMNITIEVAQSLTDYIVHHRNTQ